MQSSKSVCAIHCLNSKTYGRLTTYGSCYCCFENIALLCNIQYFGCDALRPNYIIHSHILYNIHYQSKVEHTYLVFIMTVFHILEYYQSFRNYIQIEFMDFSDQVRSAW